MPDYAFGNKESDVAAFTQAGIDPAHCYYFELDGDAQQGVVHQDYRGLVSQFESLPLVCP